MWEGRYGVSNAARILEYYALDSAAALFAHFIETIGRRMERRLPNGKVVMIQALPKGGWYMQMHSHTTEYHLRIVRAIVGCIGGVDVINWQHTSPTKIWAAIEALSLIHI